MIRAPHTHTHPRTLLLAAAALAVVATTACGGRSTAQLAKYIIENGNDETEYSISYDDGGKLTELEVQDSDGDITDKMIFEYGEDNNVREVTWENGSGDDYKSFDFEWSDEGRLVLVEQNGADDVTELSYDDSGRISEIERNSEGGFFEGKATTEYAYGDDGNLAKWEVTNVVEIGAQDVESNTEYTLTYNDMGLLEEIEVDATDLFGGTDRSNAEYTYDENGKLIEAEDQFNRDLEVTYNDAGRVDQIEFTDDNVDYAFEYTDADSSTQYHEPIGIPFSELFDLEGTSLGGRDMRSFTTYLSF